MLGRWLKLVLTGGLLSGLYLSAQANTTSPIAQAGGVEVGAVDLSSTQRTISIALVLPLRSATLREPSEVVRAGFLAAYERERDSIDINVVETGDAPQEILSGYKAASAANDIVVGPLSRTGVTAVAQSGEVFRPTLALTPPDTADNTEMRLPQHMLVMGLSIEEEARQIAGWAAHDIKDGKAVILYTRAAWQKRAAKAFQAQWLHRMREAEMVEIVSNDGYLDGRTLQQLKKDVESTEPGLLFLALDERQARQVRAVLGKDVPLYGTSQLNPFALSDRIDADRIKELDGTRLLDIPWQLQPDHPAVMVYPRLVVNSDQKRSADLERLYALGIDAYRVAREIAFNRTNFEIDGVTGKLTVRFDNANAHFERAEQPAVYRDGAAVATGTGH